MGGSSHQRSDVCRRNRSWLGGRLSVAPGGRSRFSWRRWQLRDQPFRGGHGIALSGDGGPGEGEHFGDLWILGSSDHRMAWVWHGTLPHAFTMGAVGFTALAANAASFALLWGHRGGDANMRSAWICTRNDVFGNLAVLLAALGVFGSGTGWPDVLVAAIMASLALQGAFIVIQSARVELQGARRQIAFPAE